MQKPSTKRYLVSFFIFLFGICQFSLSQDFDKVEIQTIKVAENVFMLIGAGGNIGVSVGADGILLIDSQFSQLIEKIKAAVAELGSGTIRFILNTNWHYDHTDGNELLAKAGAVIIAHEKSRNHMTKEWTVPELYPDLKRPPYPSDALPVITVSDSFTLYFNEDKIQAIHISDAHSDGDLIYHFTKANVIHTGDIYFSGGFPFINISSGGTIDGMIAAADKILGLCTADTKIIPGHGPLSNRAELQAYRHRIATARDRIAALVQKGNTLDEVLAAKPLEGLYKDGKPGPMDDIFVKVIYMDLTNQTFE